MKVGMWILSGLLLGLVWPFAGLMTIFLFDSPTAPPHVEMARGLAAVTWHVFPVAWVVALLLSIVEKRKGKREYLLKRYAWIPYWAAGAHLLAWIAVLAVMQ